MTVQSKRRKLKKFLRDNKLLFLKVGGRAGEDRIIETHHSIIGGATAEHPEYSRLIRNIVRLFE